MSNRWTIKQINETDDITFAMCILSERRAMLNQETPLAQKLKSAYHMLDKLRNGRPITDGRDNIYGSIRERIYREVEHEYTMQDITHHVTEEEHDLHGLTPDEVMGDGEIIDQIVYRFDECEIGEDYWNAMQSAVEQGIKDILERRSKAGGETDNLS